MKVFTNNKFDGYWPVGSAAVVVADSAASAAGILQNQLNIMGLFQEVSPGDMIELSTTENGCIILFDGNY